MIDLDALLPHRPPFRFLDRIDRWQADPPALVGRVRLARCPTPLLLVEALAQATRALSALCGGAGGYLGSFDLEVLEPVPAPCEVELHVLELRRIGLATRARAEARVDGRVLVRVRLTGASG